jgi:DNA-binding CsgD family transcriptional regulator/PAS domain-containing protein
MDLLASPAALSTVIGEIYDCALDPSRWPATLDRLHRGLGFVNAILGVNELPSGRGRLQAVVGIDEPWRARTLSNVYGEEVIAAWGGLEVIRTAPLDRPAVASRLNGPRHHDEMQRTNRYFLEWCAPQGLVDSIALPLARDASGIGTLAMGRHRDAGLVGDREIAAAQLLLPHLQRAVAIGRLLEDRTVTDDLVAVLDALRTPVLVVDARRTIRHANRAAQALLDAGTTLRASPSPWGPVLTATAPRAAAALADAIARTLPGLGDARAAQRGIAVPLPVGAEGHAAYVLPLRGRGLAGADGDTVAVFVAAPRAVVPGDIGALATALFGLTTAEARVLVAIAAGRTPTEAAADAGVAPSTVRTHLRHLFDKTGTRRQADLVRLAAALTPPVDDVALPAAPTERVDAMRPSRS